MATKQKTVKSKKVTKKLPSIQETISELLECYFKDLDDETPVDLYRIVTSEVEEAMINVALAHTNHTETKASILLGISRSTLRQRRRVFGHYDNQRNGKWGS